jgi:hypothetical protein
MKRETGGGIILVRRLERRRLYGTVPLPYSSRTVGRRLANSGSRRQSYSILKAHRYVVVNVRTGGPWGLRGFMSRRRMPFLQAR